MLFGIVYHITVVVDNTGVVLLSTSISLFLASPLPRIGFGWMVYMTDKSQLFIGSSHILRIFPAKSQDTCNPRWDILWIQEDKVTSSTGLVGDRF